MEAEKSTKASQTMRYKLVFCEKFFWAHTHNCQSIKVARFVVNLFHLAFVNYHKCHNHQKTTTDDLARTNVWHFYLYTLCSVALSSLLCLSHIIPHLPHIIILPSHFFASSLSFLNADRTCKFEDFYYKEPYVASTLRGNKSHYVVINIQWIIEDLCHALP